MSNKQIFTSLLIFILFVLVGAVAVVKYTQKPASTGFTVDKDSQVATQQDGPQDSSAIDTSTIPIYGTLPLFNDGLNEADIGNLQIFVTNIVKNTYKSAYKEANITQESITVKDGVYSAKARLGDESSTVYIYLTITKPASDKISLTAKDAKGTVLDTTEMTSIIKTTPTNSPGGYNEANG